MKLIIIYGPPSVGKLTVARELSKLTGFEVFHNHLTVDLLDAFYYRGKGFWPLIKKIRMDVFEACAVNDVNIIFTFCYSKPNDDAFIKETKELVEKNGGEVCFVRLHTDKKTLFSRVVNESRKEFSKIKTVEGLKEDMSKDDIFSPINFVENLEIKNDEISPEEAAKMIVEHFKLPAKKN